MLKHYILSATVLCIMMIYAAQFIGRFYTDAKIEAHRTKVFYQSIDEEAGLLD